MSHDRALIERRAAIKAHCTRVQTFLESESRSASVIELRARSQKFNATWNEFNEIQHRIEVAKSGDQANAIQEEERINFESRFFAISTALESLIEERLVANRPTHVTQDRQVRDATPLSIGGNAISDNLKLPRVNLPTFTGKYEEWHSFSNMFVSMIEQNAALPDVQKMQYLMSVLKGETYDVVSSLEASAENYREAWAMLVERYDDPGLIIGRHVKALFDLPVMSKDNYVMLRKLLDNVLKHIRALKALKRPTNTLDDLMKHLVTSRLDQSTYREWETTVLRGKIPAFDELINFLNQRCRALEATSRAQRSTNFHSHEKAIYNKSTAANVATTKITCGFCQQESHAIYRCKEFLALNTDQRMKEIRSRRLCLNCLKGTSHQAKECASGTCRKCGKRHNTLLHFEQTSKNNSESEHKSEKADDKENESPTMVNHAAINQGQQILLATALVSVLDSKGEMKLIRALLDSGSQSCFITDDCCKELALKRKSINMPICGLGGQAVPARSLVKIIMQSRTTGYRKELNCLVVEAITQRLPTTAINKSDIGVPRGIILADPQFHQTSKIDMLIGAEIFFELLCIGRIKVAENQPSWQKTVLGWIVSGSCAAREQYAKPTVCNMSVNNQLSTSLTKFWQLESCERIATRTPEERACENHFMQSYKRNNEGRFVISLPIRPDTLKHLGESKGTALQRLHSMERRLNRQPQCKRDYVEFMRDYQRLGHMRELQEPVIDNWPYFYIPHHYVIKESSTTTRLRVVFDASSQSSSGISLNKALMVGPVVQQEGISILIRFRIHKYALTGDIEKMYRQILLEQTQTSLQRILWREDPSHDVKTYELLTLTYGTASASFIATKCIQQLTELERHQFPKGAMAALRDFYVDDFISGADSRNEVLEIHKQLTSLLTKGGFRIRKWACNSNDILRDISKSSNKEQLLELDKDGSAKTLGINWSPSEDAFRYKISIQASTQAHTKRSILSQIARIFDPLGILGPVIITSKILMQRLWKMQIEWNEALPMEVHTEWASYVQDLQNLERLVIPRKIVRSGQGICREIHGFCDASELAYGACVNKKLPVFVAHRIGNIQETTSVNNWRHVGGKNNPADLISRGISAKELVSAQLWWEGPQWLHCNNLPEGQRKVMEFDESQLEKNDRSRIVAIASCQEASPFDKFSTFSKLIRIAATCLRFIHNCKRQKRYGPSTSVDELQEAIQCLIRREQEIIFVKDIQDLARQGTVSNQSSLKYLNPFIDEERLIRVGGRLRHANLQADVKHPWLLQQRSKFAELVIEHEHRKLMHAGPEATLAAIRLRYWPLKARGTVRRLLRRCIRCFKSKPRFSEQLMGDLPVHRVTPSRPFRCTGIDFCGPIHVREGSRRNAKTSKAYVAVFVCMTTKAVHLEVVSNMTTDAFLNAFKRFIGRRGKPSDVFSENGTNFIGANRELEELRDLFNKQEQQHRLMECAAADQIRWHFIPPRAPHFVGLWEATVKAFKRHFYKVTAEMSFTFEEASTLVIQIESILNSRPLIPISSDPNDFSYISAGHFLIGDAIVSYPEPDVTQTKVNRLSRWQHLELMRQHFWRRWSSEYLLQLQNRTKWYSNRGPAFKVGQLVICREDGVPPLKWVLGRVQETCPGSDGIVRAAIIKTPAGLFKRPAAKLAILPMEEDLDTKRD